MFCDLKKYQTDDVVHISTDFYFIPSRILILTHQNIFSLPENSPVWCYFKSMAPSFLSNFISMLLRLYLQHFY